MEKNTPVDNLEVGYLLPARRNADQAPETHSDEFSGFNYAIGAYVKPGTAMQHLEGYLGQADFDKIMRGYYQTWQFKHPYPEDFRAYAEANTDKNLDWFFDGYINSTYKMDYAITGISSQNDAFQLTVKNKNILTAPFPVSAVKNDSIVETRWYEGFEGRQEITFPKGDYDQFILDAQHITLELHRTNNIIKTSGFLKKVEPIRLKIAPSFENPRQAEVFFLPAMGYNVHDKLMAGLTFYNRVVPSKRLEFVVTPMYAFGTKDLTGLGNIEYHIYPKKNTGKTFTLGLDAKRFSFAKDDSLRSAAGSVDVVYKYAKFAPYLEYSFKSSPKSNITQNIRLQAHFINEEVKVNDDVSGLFAGKKWTQNPVYRLTYTLNNKNVLMPFFTEVNLEQFGYQDIFGNDNHYLKSSLELKTAYVYDQNRQVDFRFFLGYFLENTEKITKKKPKINLSVFSWLFFREYRKKPQSAPA